MATLHTADDSFDNAESIDFLRKMFAQMILDCQGSAIVEYVNNCNTLNSDINFFEWWNDERGIDINALIALVDNTSRQEWASDIANDYVDYLGVWNG